MKHLLNSLSRRAGFFLALAFVMGLSLLWISDTRRSYVSALDKLELSKHEQHARLGYTILSDLQRVTNTLVLERLGTADPAEVETALHVAGDLIYVRGWTIDTRSEDVYAPGKRQFLSDALRALTAEIDYYLSLPEEDRAARLPELVADTEALRVATVQFIDETRRVQSKLIERQEALISGQRYVHYGLGLALALISLTALFLLRQEVTLRTAREADRRRAEYLAYNDALTGLPNRVSFSDRVESMLDKGGPMSIVMADVDLFKKVNDTQGHQVGDSVLRTMAQRMLRTAEAYGGFVARLAGDEFAVFLPTEDPEVLRDFGQDLHLSSLRPIWHSRGRVTTGLSQGIASAASLDLSNRTTALDRLLRAADFALYISKEQGRGRCTLYDVSVEAKYNEQQSLLDDLRTAVSLSQIAVHLQPQVHLDSGSVYGFEALARWRRKGENVSPEIFVPIAEEAGFVSDLDRQVLRTSVKHVAAWNRAHGTEFSVSVNVSGASLMDLKLVRSVESVLQAAAFPAPLLTLEITESVQLEDAEMVRQQIDALRVLGCRISIDDFGTGYSSLASLRQLKADELKIDKSLVTEVESSGQVRVILDSVVGLVHSYLGLEVVVEGIERTSQLAELRAVGCQRAQGYLFGRPLPPHEALQRAMIPAIPPIAPPAEAQISSA